MKLKDLFKSRKNKSLPAKPVENLPGEAVKELKKDPPALKRVQVAGEIKRFDDETTEAGIPKSRFTSEYQEFLARQQEEAETVTRGAEEPDPRIASALALAKDNREALKNDKTCGCFACLAIFDPAEITDWNGDTAICPYCGQEAVIGESSGLPINAEVLSEINKFRG